MEVDNFHLSTAIEDFRAVRSQAALKEILARFTGEPVRLLSFEEVRQKLKGSGSSEKGLRDIPLDAIVGSVGRYTDFTRDFLPLNTVDEERWARVKVATTELSGLPPIEVYQIGEVYFVKDGNHRVSVARQMGATHIQAYVTEVRTRVPLTLDADLDNLIIQAEYAEFLEKTQLDLLRSEANLIVTVPGKYDLLLEHISVHRYFMGIDEQREISEEEAVAHWYDTVYSPVINLIRSRGILHYFPERTETDLYLWIAEHRAALAQDMGWDIAPDSAVGDLVARYSQKRGKKISRVGSRLLERLKLDKLESGPTPGAWRLAREATRQSLFQDMLVAVSGTEKGWKGLEQALIIARRENARLHGLHVLSNEEARSNPEAKAVQERFNQRCLEAGVDGKLILTTGEVAPTVCQYGRVTDLLVANLSYPPGQKPFERLSSGFVDMVRRCIPPLLAVPNVSPLERALLAYDGSPKADEALFIATYLAAKWQISLTVISVINNGTNLSVLDQAKQYLGGRNVQADYLAEEGPVAETIFRTAEEREIDFIIMGGYGNTPVVEIVLGSVVDQVLRECYKPVLICR